MSDTPRTDAFYEANHSDCVGLEHARQLERELAAVKAELAKVEAEKTDAITWAILLQRAEKAETERDALRSLIKGLGNGYDDAAIDEALATMNAIDSLSNRDTIHSSAGNR